MELFGYSQGQPAFIRFKNNTHYDVEIIWINVNNKEKIYNILSPNNFLDVNTYSTHPWIFKFVYFSTICFDHYYFFYSLFVENAYQKIIW